MPRHAPWLLASAALAWTLALPLAAWAVWHGVSPGREFAWAVYAFGQAICHQRAERSFSWGEVPWPVCARCSGLYLGAAIGAWIGLFGRVRTAMPSALARRWLLVAACPTALTVIVEWASGRAPSNLTRGGTGVILGGVAAALIIHLIREPEATHSGVASEVN